MALESNRSNLRMLTLPSWVMFLVFLVLMVFSAMGPSGVIVFGLVWTAWLLMLGFSLQERMPEPKRRAKWIFAAKLCYFVLYGYLSRDWDVEGSTLFIVMHLLAAYAIFSALFFVARSLVIAEEQRTSGFDRYLGTFFLLWFVPVGIWFVQPRIRKVLTEKGFLGSGHANSLK